MSYAIAQNSQHNSADAGRAVRIRRRLQVLAFLAVCIASIVVVLGAFTRLKDAGLGCPDWPGCYGHLMWPSSAEEVANAEARFPDAPVEHDKTWPEMVHRYFAGGLGLMIFALFAITLKARKVEPFLPLKLPLFISILVVLQGAFGMWTVTLKLWPQVVTAHLLGGFATLSLLWLYWLRLRYPSWRVPTHVKWGRLKVLALTALVVAVMQVALGGWTSSNYAALACADFPTCHGVYWPEADYGQGFNVLQEVGPNYLGGLLDNHARTAIHFTHRLGAIAVLLIVSILAISLWRTAFGPARRLAMVLVGALVAQLLLGISNVIFALPLTVAVAHNAGGALLIMVIVLVSYRLLTYRSTEEART